MEDEAIYERSDMAERASYPDRLMAANMSMQFTNIRGKSYAEVNQRILAFWSLFPNGRIITKKVSDDGQRCDFECYVYRDEADEKPAVVGHAYEVRSKGVNQTSYIENCETSAVGRALGMLGIGATNSIASADEVLQAIKQQESQQEQPDKDGIDAHCESCGTAYHFESQDHYIRFIDWLGNNPCCDNPNWRID